MAIIFGSLDMNQEKLRLWKKKTAKKGLPVNMLKTEQVAEVLNRLTNSGTYPCVVCCKSVGINSIHCGYRHNWVHKRCTKVSGSLTAGVNFKCQRCLGMAPFYDKRLSRCIIADREEI